MRVALEMSSVGRIFNVDPQLLALYGACEFSGIFLMGVMGRWAVTGLVRGGYWCNWRIPFHVNCAPVNTVGRQVRRAVSPLEDSVRGAARVNEPTRVGRLRHHALENTQREVEGEQQ